MNTNNEQTNATNKPGNAPPSNVPAPPSTDPTFSSPKAGIPTHHQHKTTVIVDDRDYRLLDSWRNRPGTFIRTIAIITHKLTLSLQQHGLKPDSYDPDTYEYLINNCRITFPVTGATTFPVPDGSPVIVPITHTGEANNGNVTGGVGAVSRPDEKAPVKSTNAKGALRRRVGKSGTAE